MKTSIVKRLFAVVAAVIWLLAAAGCGSQPATAPQDDSLQKIRDAGQLVLGLDTEFPPMGFIDEEGEIVGFDIDVAQEVCNRLGVALVKRGIDWNEKENDLNSGLIDCIWNGFSVTPGRQASMCLSEPYMKNELIVVVTEDSEIKSLRDLRKKKIGVQSGSTAKEALEDSVLVPDKTVVPCSTVPMLMQKLKEKELDAALVDSVAAYYFIFSQDENYYILSDSIGEEEFAVGFRKHDVALRDKIQQIISGMKTDGTLGEISKKWFGSDITTVK